MLKWFTSKKAVVVPIKNIQIDMHVKTITKDNVKVTLTIAVGYSINPDKVKGAYYKVANAEQGVRIQPLVVDVVQAKVPEMALTELLVKKLTFAEAVKIEISSAMADYGYNIIEVRIIDFDPDLSDEDMWNLRKLF